MRSHHFTSDFYHQKMTHRQGQTHKKTLDEKITLRLFPLARIQGLDRVGRLADHLRSSLTMFWHTCCAATGRNDVAFIGFPPIETAFFCSLALRARRIPISGCQGDLWLKLFRWQDRPEEACDQTGSHPRRSWPLPLNQGSRAW